MTTSIDPRFEKGIVSHQFMQGLEQGGTEYLLLPAPEDDPATSSPRVIRRRSVTPGSYGEAPGDMTGGPRV